MAPLFNKVQVVPTGGAVALRFTTAASGNITLSRAVSGAGGIGVFEPIYQGQPLAASGINQFFLDYGDGLPAPLVSGTAYVYQLADQNGITQTAGVLTPSSFNLESDGITQIMQRLLQAAVTNNIPPTGVKPARVAQAMPLNGMPPMPFVVLTPELLQQHEQQIGEDVELPDNNNIWTMSEFASRLFRISAIAQTAVERDYYRNLIVAVFKMACAYVFSQIGDNVTHTWQAASYQVSDANQGLGPGFYGVDVLVEITGTFNLAIMTSYGLIETIVATASGAISGVTPPVQIQVQVPTI